MKMTQHALASMALVSLISCFLANSAQAQGTFPNRALRIIVPYTPGAVTDTTSRAVAAELSKELGQPIIIDNRPGAATAIGTVAAKNSPADGYTLLYQSNAMVSNLYLMKEPGYALADFKTVSGLSESAFVMAMTKTRGFKSLNDLVEFGKANPRKLLYSTTGAGSSASIVAAKLGQAGNFDWVEVPFKGGAEATQAAMTGVTDVFMASQGAPLIQGNPENLSLVAITSSERSDLLPNIPTFKELGYPSVVYETWSALFIRSDVPADITEKLKTALAKVMSSPDLIEQMKKLSIPPYHSNLEDLPTKLEKETRDFAVDAKQLGIEPQ